MWPSREVVFREGGGGGGGDGNAGDSGPPRGMFVAHLSRAGAYVVGRCRLTLSNPR